MFFFRFLNLGIGRDLCERLDALGAEIYAISRSPQPLAELKAARPRINTIHLDVSDWNNTRAELQKHLKDVQIDGLVNNAAIAISKPVTELNEQDFDKYVLCTHQLKFMFGDANCFIFLYYFCTKFSFPNDFYTFVRNAYTL